MQSSAHSTDMKARSNYGRLHTVMENPRQTVRISVRGLVVVFVLFSLGPTVGAWAQDAMSSRYAAIRAPTDKLINRISRQRLQADLNALAREQSRVRIRRREAERLRYKDPVSGFAAAERALDARLDRIDIDRRETAARLADLARQSGEGTVSARPPLHGTDGADAGLRAYPAPLGERSAADAVAAARSFVDELLSANRARP